MLQFIILQQRSPIALFELNSIPTPHSQEQRVVASESRSKSDEEDLSDRKIS